MHVNLNICEYLWYTLFLLFSWKKMDPVVAREGKLYPKIQSGESKLISGKECGKVIRKKAILKMHTRTHTGKLQFKCSDCEKHFSSNQTLRNHQMIHTGIGLQECQVCGKKFNTEHNLKRHCSAFGISQFHLRDMSQKI